MFGRLVTTPPHSHPPSPPHHHISGATQEGRRSKDGAHGSGAVRPFLLSRVREAIVGGGASRTSTLPPMPLVGCDALTRPMSYMSVVE